jgi:hypothetical protein
LDYTKKVVTTSKMSEAKDQIASYAQWNTRRGDVNTIEKALCVVRHKMLEKNKNIKAIVLYWYLFNLNRLNLREIELKKSKTHCGFYGNYAASSGIIACNANIILLKIIQ